MNRGRIAGRTPKRRPKRIVVPETIPSALDRIPVGVAVRILASRLPKDRSATPRTTEDKVRHRIRDAITGGFFDEQGGRVVFGEVVGWAREIADWASYLAGLPAIQRAEALLRPTAAVTSHPSVKYATDVASERLADAMTQIERLKSELLVATKESDALRPDADAYRAFREKSRQNARRSRKQ